MEKIKDDIIKVLKSPLTYILMISIIIENIIYRFFDSYSIYNDSVSYIEG